LVFGESLLHFPQAARGAYGVRWRAGKLAVSEKVHNNIYIHMYIFSHKSEYSRSGGRFAQKNSPIGSQGVAEERVAGILGYAEFTKFRFRGSRLVVLVFCKSCEVRELREGEKVRAGIVGLAGEWRNEGDRRMWIRKMRAVWVHFFGGSSAD
jgi:hypothetical protein